MFRSVFHLGLCLRCTNGTPVADMLEHSSPLPLVIDYHTDGNRGLSEEDEWGIMLALQHLDSERRIRLLMPHQDLQKFITAIGEEFPMLEFLYLSPLRHLALCDFAFPMVFSSFAPTVGFVTLSLDVTPSSAYFCPNSLLQWVSLIPKLWTLRLVDYKIQVQMAILSCVQSVCSCVHVLLRNDSVLFPMFHFTVTANQNSILVTA